MGDCTVLVCTIHVAVYSSMHCLVYVYMYDYIRIPCVQVKTIIFDKTGTLTHGKPVVTSVMIFVSEAVCSSRLFTALVGLAETNSEHPLGTAVVKYAKTVSGLQRAPNV